MYVKFGELPTLWYYDFRDAGILTDYALPVGSPQEGRYYIGIYGYSSAYYDIRIRVNGTVLQLFNFLQITLTSLPIMNSNENLLDFFFTLLKCR